MTIVLEDYKGFQKTIPNPMKFFPPEIVIPLYRPLKFNFNPLPSQTDLSKPSSIKFYKSQRLADSVYLYKSEEEL